jgi:BirA family transcriptional regulator, biotin operon repressor / biotin---[acetyl-CoA-carboxylase] ligase
VSRWGDLERPPLDVRALNQALADGGLWREIRVVDETGSTNADVGELARRGEPEGLVLVAEHQTAGRGRLGRGWVAPARSGLFFSMLLRPGAVPVSRWPMVPLLVGVGVARAVGRVAEIEVALKWPNDVMIGERKLGGILAELVDSSDGPAIVVGIGLNVTLREAELPVPTAISLALAEGSCTDRETLLRASLRGVAAEYEMWHSAAGDPEATLAAYRELCVTIGRDVRVELPGDRAVVGHAVGVDPDGSLVIETPDGRTGVTAGDVVHVR